MRKKHFTYDIQEEQSDTDSQVLTLLQFARKAGKIVYGFEPCIKNIASGKVHLLIMTTDLSTNTKDKVMNVIRSTECQPTVKEYGNQQQLSAALGVPFTGIIGILDNNFATKLLSYLSR